MFHGFGQMCVSFGKALNQSPAYFLLHHRNNLCRYQNPNIINHSCSAIAGSSGALLHRIGTIPNYSIDIKTGAQPQAFIGIHIGGDVSHCEDCLSIAPSARHCKSHSEADSACAACRMSGCSQCRTDSKYTKNILIVIYADM